MKQLYLFLVHFFHILFLKCVYFKRIQISFFENFHGKYGISIKGKNARILFSKNISTRNGFFCRVSEDGVLKIGKRVFFNYNCMIASMNHITIGDDCIFGNNVTIIDHDHNYLSYKFKDDFLTSEIVIGDGTWVGANVVILRGAHIGSGCVIGAGTVVSGNIPENSIVTGTRELKIKNKYYAKREH